MFDDLVEYALDFENAFGVFGPTVVVVAIAAFCLRPITGAVPGVLDDPINRQPMLGQMHGKEPFDMTKKEMQLWQKIRFSFGIIFALASLFAGFVGIFTDALGGSPKLLGYSKFTLVVGTLGLGDHIRMYHERTKLGIQFGKWPLLVACAIPQAVVCWYHYSFFLALADKAEKDGRVKLIQAGVMTSVLRSRRPSRFAVLSRTMTSPWLMMAMSSHISSASSR